MIAARNYAYANIAAYEVIAAADKNYTSLAGQINGLKDIPFPDEDAKVDYPFAALLAFCKVGNAVTFPEGSMDAYVGDLKEKVKMPACRQMFCMQVLPMPIKWPMR